MAKGAISARAEEPPQERSTAYDSGGDLRAGGGTFSVRLPKHRATGRSPRGRRNHQYEFDTTMRDGAISARAEEPLQGMERGQERRGDLRAGGGTSLAHLPGVRRSGRSPRGRRNRAAGFLQEQVEGAISARAEEPFAAGSIVVESRGDLRAGGGTGGACTASRSRWGRSPRGRRNPISEPMAAQDDGAISARAEEPRHDGVKIRGRGGDLRAGGGTQSVGIETSAYEGRSPRGRRNQSYCQRSGGLSRAISARAEEPSERSLSASPTGGDLRAGGGTQRQP